MSILKNTTASISYPLLSYQQALLNRLRSGGSLPGEMSIITSGRQIGKSYITTLYRNEISPPMRKVKEAKYKFSRAKWYTASYNGHEFVDVHSWCIEQFGPPDRCPDAWSRWGFSVELWLTDIYFRDEEDYVLFLLRWS